MRFIENLKKNWKRILNIALLVSLLLIILFILSHFVNQVKNIFTINAQVLEQWRQVEKRVSEIEAKLPVLKKELSILEKQVQEYENVKNEGLEIIQSEKLQSVLKNLNSQFSFLKENLEDFKRK